MPVVIPNSTDPYVNRKAWGGTVHQDLQKLYDNGGGTIGGLFNEPTELRIYRMRDYTDTHGLFEIQSRVVFSREIDDLNYAKLPPDLEPTDVVRICELLVDQLRQEIAEAREIHNENCPKGEEVTLYLERRASGVVIPVSSDKRSAFFEDLTTIVRERQEQEQDLIPVELTFAVQRCYIHEGTATVELKLPEEVVQDLATGEDLPDHFTHKAEALAREQIDDIELKLTDQLREAEDQVEWTGDYRRLKKRPKGKRRNHNEPKDQDQEG